MDSNCEKDVTGAAAPFVNRVITRNELGFKTADDFVTGISPVNTNFHLQDRNHDASDRLERVNSDSIDDNTSTNTIYTYNSNGNLIDGGGKDFTYDYEDRLTSYQESGDQIQFTYDGQGNRTQRTENGLTRQQVLDYGAALSNVLMEKDANGNIVRYYIWGNGLIAQIEANGTTHYTHADEQGSTIALTDANGIVTDQIAYSPYGEILNRSGTTDIPYLYIGGFGVYYEGHHLHHMKARYYDARLKRFLTKDPIGLDGGSNLYAYANGNPVVFVDPEGTFVITLSAAIIVGGGVINGTISAISQARSGNSSIGNIAGSFGKGFVSGATGTAAGLAVAIASKNPALIGAAASTTTSLVDQAFQGEFSFTETATDVAIGAVVGPLASKVPLTKIKPGTFKPKLNKVRNFNDLGPNSKKILATEGFISVGSSVSDTIIRKTSDNSSVAIPK